MQNKNVFLRDPIIYRIVYDKNHLRTRSKFRAYPLYDFANPIIDFLEGINVAVRIHEFHDREPFYKWV